MAEFTGSLCPGDINEVYSRTVVELGTRVQDTEGNEYIFLLGVANTVAGSWVTYDEVGITTLLAANAIGPVAVAQAAIVADKLGWYQIYGTTVGCAGATLDVNDVVGRTGADGFVGDGPPAGDIIYNCIARAGIADGSASTTSTFTIQYPYVDNETAGH